MKALKILTVGLIALGVAVTGSCSSSDGGPSGGPGTLAVVLDTPNTDDAAIQLTVTGDSIKNVTAPGAFTKFENSSGNTVSLVVLGALTDGQLVSFDVPNTSGSYVAAIVDVAGPDNALRNKSDYSLTVE